MSAAEHQRAGPQDRFEQRDRRRAIQAGTSSNVAMRAKTSAAAIATPRGTRTGNSAIGIAVAEPRRKSAPMPAPRAIGSHCSPAPAAIAIARIAAPIAIVRVSRSVHRERASESTACATTAAAAAVSPASRPANQPLVVTAPLPSSACRASAKAVIAIAEGAVKPSQAAKAPPAPARVSPINIPTWLEVGPGSTEQNATSAANVASSSQPRRSTNSRRK